MLYLSNSVFTINVAFKKNIFKYKIIISYEACGL